jgi:predicted ATPase
MPLQPLPRMARFPRARALVGRSEASVRLDGALAQGAAIVSILGPPGVGKTALAVSAVERLTRRRPAWFCDVSSQRTELGLVVEVMALFGQPLATDDPRAAVVLAGQRLASLGDAIVVLDGFEPLAPFAAALGEWVALAPELTLLVTSRERLAVEGEQVIELAPLDEDAAARLFRERATEVGARVDEGDREAVLAIVRSVDGLPLAIELAAARARLLRPRELALRLRDGEDVLTVTRRGPARHRSLSDAIASSWALLERAEREALAILSVFEGDFAAATAEAVLERALEPGAEPSALTLLAALCEKSLVHTASDDRLGLYSSIRTFAWQALAGEPAQRRRAEAAHAAYFRELAARFARARLTLVHVARGGSFADVSRHVPDLESALERTDELTARLELASALAFLGVATDPVRSALGLAASAFDRAADASAIALLASHHLAIASGRHDDATALAHAVIARTELAPELRAVAWQRHGIARRAEGDPEEAVRAHEQVTALIGSAPTTLGAVNVACTGRLMVDLRRDEEARVWNERARALCDAMGEPWLAELGPANLAQLEQERGSYDRAEALLAPAIARFRAAREPLYEAVYAVIAGGLYLEQGALDLAARWYRSIDGGGRALLPAFFRVLLHGGWGVLEALRGEPLASAEQIELARRSLATGPGRLAGSIVELYAAAATLLAGRAPAAELAAVRARVAPLLDPRTPEGARVERNVDARFARRLLVRALERTAPHPRVRIERDGSSFAVAGAPPVSLRSRGALRRIVSALAEAHARGDALDVPALFGAGWPGQRIRAESASMRVRVAIAMLRKMGLREVIVTSEAGYAFAQDATVELTR